MNHKGWCVVKPQHNQSKTSLQNCCWDPNKKFRLPVHLCCIQTKMYSHFSILVIFYIIYTTLLGSPLNCLISKLSCNESSYRGSHLYVNSGLQINTIFEWILFLFFHYYMFCSFIYNLCILRLSLNHCAIMNHVIKHFLGTYISILESDMLLNEYFL